MKRQKCTECEKPSIPGIKRGHGKCQYHWNAGVWGKAWANIETIEKETPNREEQ